MTKDEALKLALEKFEFMNDVDSIFEGEFNFQINAIKKALAQPESWEKFCDSNCVWTDHHPDCKLAQPEQEPKCGAIIEVFGKDWRLEYMSLPVGKHKLYTQQYTYTTPPQRTWVGLTEKDICEAAVKSQEGISPRDDTLRFAIAIEAKLKEKNT